MTQNQTSEMTLKSLITDYAAYNLWANKSLVDWLKTKPVEVFTQPVPSSYPSLQNTLMHIWDVEQNWFGRMQNMPINAFTWNGFDGTLEDIIEGIIEQSENALLFVQSLTEEQLQEGFFFSIPYVGDHTLPRFELMMHAFNHSTYHRGQLVTIGRNLGFTDAPMTDFMFYILREKHKTNE